VSIPPHLWFRMGGVDVDAARETIGGLCFETVSPGRVLVTWGMLGPDAERVDATDPDDLTRIELACRDGVVREVARLRAEVPGFEHAWLDDVAKMLGITESRRLVGDLVLTKDDGDVRFADSVAQTGHWTKRGVVYDVPYRCLTTRSVANLLVAGRCISTSRYVHQATKEIPAAMATGEAAGAAAAHALGAGGAVHDVDVARLRADLHAAGASVGGPAPTV
jgi:hypothetical protein